MAQQIINVGSAPNDGLGDPIRTAYIKCNTNFSELFSRAQVDPPETLIGNPGDTAGMYAYDENYFYYCYADYDGSSQIWGQISEAGNIAVSAINNGTSNVSIPNSAGNVLISVAGSPNVVVVSTQGIATGGNISANTVTANTVAGTLSTASQPNITSLGTLTSLTVSGNVTGGNVIASGNIAVSNVSVTGNVVAARFIGDGSGLTGVTATANVGAATQLTNGTTSFNIPVASGNVIGNINASTFVYVFTEQGANVAGYVTATGNITGGNISAGSGQIQTTGNITAGNLSITGSFSTTGVSATTLTATGNVTGGNLVTTGVVSASGNITGGNVIGGGLVAVSNISGGNLSVTGTATATGNVTGGNIVTTGIVSASGNITGGNVIATQFVGTAVQSDATKTEVGGSTNTDYYITYVESTGGYQVLKTDSGLLFNPSSNQITANTVVATTGFSGTLTGNVSGNLSGNVSGTTVTATANVAGGNITTAGQVVATGNITGGNLRTSGVTINSTGITAPGALTINSSNGATAIVNGGSNATGNIGSASTYFDTVFATATTALYADLAEKYLADADYEPGTVLCFGGEAEVTQCNIDSCPAVAGVVSTRPAYQMNSGLEGDHVVAMALVGRVPVLVQGPVKRGDMMVSAGNGRARAEKNPAMGTVIGKALTSFDGDQGTIEVVVGKL